MSDHSLDENETRLRLVNPALALAGWSPSQIAEEFATGRVGSDGKREPGRADYVLQVRGDRGMLPVAVLEAKSESREPDAGVEQAAAYARALSVSHAFSTNGREFVSVDLATGAVASRRPLAEFPGPNDLRLDDVELNESVHIRKRRLSDVEIRDERGQIVEDRRLRRLAFALWKRGWSDNRDGRQPLGLRLMTVTDDDEGDTPFVVEFVPPGTGRESHIEGAVPHLILLGKISVAKYLKVRSNRAVERSSSDDAPLLYFSDGRYFFCEDERRGTRTDQLPLSRFPTPEDLYSTVRQKPRAEQPQVPSRRTTARRKPGAEWPQTGEVQPGRPDLGMRGINAWAPKEAPKPQAPSRQTTVRRKLGAEQPQAGRGVHSVVGAWRRKPGAERLQANQIQLGRPDLGMRGINAWAPKEAPKPQTLSRQTQFKDDSRPNGYSPRASHTLLGRHAPGMPEIAEPESREASRSSSRRGFWKRVFGRNRS